MSRDSYLAYSCYRFVRFLSRLYSLRLSHSSMSNCSTGERLFICYCGIWIFIISRLWPDEITVLICSLVTRRDNCSFINGEYAKSGLDELEKWCSETNEEVLVSFFLILLLSINTVSHLCDLPLIVCWLILGCTRTYQTSCWIPGMF